MLTLTIKEREVLITTKESFIRGTVGAKCTVIFEDFWKDYYKNIVFKRVSNDFTKPYRILIDGLSSEIEIPFEILAESGAFIVGAYGTTETKVTPTLWSENIKIEYGTSTNGTTPEKYSPDELEQLRISKQDKLIAGKNIVIRGNVISAETSGEGEIDITVDQTYNPDSENAQSGKAVEEALANKMDKFGEVTIIEDEITFYGADGEEVVITSSRTPQASYHLTNKSYVDDYVDAGVAGAVVESKEYTDNAISTAIGEALESDY